MGNSPTSPDRETTASRSGGMIATTRRRFIAATGAAAVGASALLGKLVAFSPTANAAVNLNCYPMPSIDYSCWGTCEPFQSCCRAGTKDGNPVTCCCTCPEGPYQCKPATFRARALSIEGPDNDKCCCATCY